MKKEQRFQQLLQLVENKKKKEENKYSMNQIQKSTTRTMKHSNDNTNGQEDDDDNDDDNDEKEKEEIPNKTITVNPHPMNNNKIIDIHHPNTTSTTITTHQSSNVLLVDDKDHPCPPCPPISWDDEMEEEEEEFITKKITKPSSPAQEEQKEEKESSSPPPQQQPRRQQQPTIQGKKLQQEFIQRTTRIKYQEMKRIRQNLPISSFREVLLHTIQEHCVTIVCAETGAGKTTQCPQYILEEALQNGYGDEIKIIITQPRRVAATSIAERVAQELCEPTTNNTTTTNNSCVGYWVGYQIRLESQYHPIHTKLLFCTTGIVLKRLQDDDDPTLHGITHIIIDEVHERQQQIDVLLIAIRYLLATTRPDLKVILVCIIYIYVVCVVCCAMCVLLCVLQQPNS